MKKSILIFTLLFYFAFSNAQKEASNWYFGDNAGIQFDIDMGSVTPLSDGALSTEEGCTSISDANGNLLFYTNGENVYDKNHNIMPNGTGLFGNQSSTQSAIIIPKPQNTNIYYIITQDTAFNRTPDSGFNYSEVDMTLNGGFGDVTSKNQFLLHRASEKLSAVLKDCESQNVWIVTFANQTAHTNPNAVDNNNNAFFAFEVAASGINLTPVISTIPFNISERRGYLKFSPNGKKLASANLAQGLFLYDFDILTGEVSNQQQININFNSPNGQPQYSYGVEFSPNSQLLYVSTYNSNGSGGLLQYNLNATNISSSMVPIHEGETYRTALQLGPNGKIYRSSSISYNIGEDFLSVINEPNLLNTNCNYVHDAVDLAGKLSRQGLPPFITSFFSESIDLIQNNVSTTNLALCDGDTYTLTAENIPEANYTWTLDNVLLAENDFTLIINNTNGAGLYQVLIETNDGNCGTIEGKAIVTFSEVPVANTPSNLSSCSDISGNDTATFNFDSQTPTVLGTQTATQFNVSYFSSQADADANINSISSDYQNTSNPQTIFVRIENIDNENCFDFTEFEILVYKTPTIETIEDYVICDGDTNTMDGKTMLTLSNFNTIVFGAQNPTLYTISYHETQADANTGINNHPNNYTNQIAFSEPLFIRIENNIDTSCYSTSNINLIINPIPEAFNADIYQCDEQGMVDGFTTFNLNQLNDDLTGGIPDRTIQFYLSTLDAQNSINEINGNAFNNTTNPQIIYVKVTNDLTGCFNFSTLTLETSSTQINDYIATPVCDELGSEDGIDIFNLDDFSTDILSGLPAGLDISYYESANDALLENNALSSPYQNTTAYSQTIFVRVENDNACYGINEVLLTINPRPIIDNDETLFYCLNEFPSTLTLDTGLNDNTASYSFSWLPNMENTETIAINTVGTYTVTVTNNTTSCNKTRTFIVEPSNTATIEDIEIIDGSLNNNQVVIITSGEGEYQYALTNQDGYTTPFQTSNVFTQLSPGIYNVTIRDIKNNCGITEDMISIIGFPLYFTPNNDGENDTWQVYGVSNLFQPNSEILIFNRFGKIITQIKPSSSGWDGTFNGQLMPQSDYWFSVTLQDGRVYKNHFTLKR